MKQILSVMLLVSLLLASPAEKTEEPRRQQTTADDIAQAIINTQPDGAAYVLQTGEDAELYLTHLYGLEGHTYTDAAVYAVGGADGREIAVVKPSSMVTYHPAIGAALEEYRQNRGADFYGYIPDQAALVEGGAVVAGWGWVALLLCEDMSSAKAAFEERAGQASVYRPAEGGQIVGLSPSETRWCIPFDPPNKVDMTLYDTAAIRKAWDTGETGGLSEKDAAILEKCREVIATQITEDMTDLEKERALYDWLIDWGESDDTVYDPHTPQGRPDNTNPYGMLVGGYGICLGFATTFQLLADLAGVECITVVGAEKENRQDHAWNMVRLEGQWYCVDAAWDDSRAKVGDYEFFNVTSSYMRDTNHQWDYLNVPEATATDHGEGAGKS